MNQPDGREKTRTILTISISIDRANPHPAHVATLGKRSKKRGAWYNKELRYFFIHDAGWEECLRGKQRSGVPAILLFQLVVRRLRFLSNTLKNKVALQGRGW
jgi:hypothetical protein